MILKTPLCSIIHYDWWKSIQPKLTWPTPIPIQVTLAYFSNISTFYEFGTNWTDINTIERQSAENKLGFRIYSASQSCKPARMVTYNWLPQSIGIANMHVHIFMYLVLTWMPTYLVLTWIPDKSHVALKCYFDYLCV